MNYCSFSRIGNPLAACAAFSLLLASCEPKPGSTAGGEKPAAERASEPLRTALNPAEPTSFDEVAAQLDAGGSFYLYLSTQTWLAGLADQLKPLRDSLATQGSPTTGSPDQKNLTQGFDLFLDLWRQSGIENLTGIGSSSIATGPGIYRSKFFAHHPKGKSDGFFWSMFGQTPHKLEILPMLPPQTALAYAIDLDLPRLVGGIGAAVEHSGNPEIKKTYQQGLAAISGATGIPTDAALQSLVGSAALILTLDPAKQVTIPAGPNPLTIPRPSLALLLPAKDERIFEQLEKLASSQPNVSAVNEPGLKMRIMSETPVSPDFLLRPALARWGNYIILASDDGLVRAMMAAGKEGNGAASSPEFQKLRQGLPTEGNGFQLMTPLFADTVAKVQQSQLQSMPAQQAALMKQLVQQTSGASALVIYSHLENGWLSVGNSMRKDPTTTGSALIAAMLGAIGLPAIEAASDKAKATLSANRARQIGMACLTYAGEHQGKFPGALQELAPKYLPDPAALKSPFAPNEPEGFKYSPGLSSNSPPETILAEDAHAASAGHRVILRVSGAVEERKTGE